jgi:hypothetical protein
MVSDKSFELFATLKDYIVDNQLVTEIYEK